LTRIRFWSYTKKEVSRILKIMIVIKTISQEGTIQTCNSNSSSSSIRLIIFLLKQAIQLLIVLGIIKAYINMRAMEWLPLIKVCMEVSLTEKLLNKKGLQCIRYLTWNKGMENKWRIQRV
jgi:hypothetical protein